MTRCALFVALVSLGSVAAAQEGGRWRPLFDGKSTAGWRGFRQPSMPDGWKVVDGVLTRTGKAGDIVTVDEFGDFELRVEWKIAPGGNSGIFYRVTEDDEVMWHTAPEMQIIDDAGYRSPLKPAQTSGANYDLHAPARSVAKPAGEWNTSRIVARGTRIEHWLNGVKVVDYEIGSADWEERVKASKFKDYPRYARARRGRIGIQDHGDEVAFRSIRVRSLE